MKTCGDCEYFGDYDKLIYADEYIDETGPGGRRIIYRPVIGFDESKGAICVFPRTGTKTRAYDSSPACHNFKARTWVRPESCHNCSRKHGEMSDGDTLCSGWPFYKKDGDEPCQNGHAAIGAQLTLF